MRIEDVMSTNVITAEPDTPLTDVASSMVENGIGAIPVLDHGALVGIVERRDVLPFEEDPDRTLRTAADVMHRDVLSFHPAIRVAEAIRAMALRTLTHAPVVVDGRVIGLVSESDLLLPYVRTDEAIKGDVEEALHAPAAGAEHSPVGVSVEEGVVRLTGSARGSAQHAIVLRLVRAIPGVRAIRDELNLERVPRSVIPLWERNPHAPV